MSPQAQALTECQRACLKYYNAVTNLDHVLRAKKPQKKCVYDDAEIRKYEAKQAVLRIGEGLAKGE